MADWEALRQRLEHVNASIRLWFGIVVFTFTATLMLASKTDFPTGGLFLDMLLWGIALWLSGYGICRLAKFLRAANFGDTPPQDPPDRQDLLGYAIASMAGPMLLIWFVPRLAELHPETFSELLFELRARWVDGLLVLFGVGLCGWPMYVFYRYVMRR